MADPGTDQPGEEDGDEQPPGGGEEAETDTELALDAKHYEERHRPDAPGHVSRTPGKGGFRWTEPDRVYSIDVIISTDVQRQVTSCSSAEQVGDPRSEVHP
jgi:hypothetical protein